MRRRFDELAQHFERALGLVSGYRRGALLHVACERLADDVGTAPAVAVGELVDCCTSATGSRKLSSIIDEPGSASSDGMPGP